MRIIIDGVFNHIGINSWPFEDVRRRQQDSPYKDWFVIRSWDNPQTGERFTTTAGPWCRSCEINEAVINSCVVNGREMGDTLYAMGVMGWFMLVTIPTGLLALLVFLLFLLVEWLVARPRSSRPSATSDTLPQSDLPAESN